MVIDAMILTVIAFFGLWVINKHYDNAWKIEQMEIKIKKNGKIVDQDEASEFIEDFRQMQTDIINIRQDCINIDAKYKIKDRWAVNKIEEIINHQFKYIEKIMKEGKFETIRLPYFGKFSVKQKRIEYINNKKQKGGRPSSLVLDQDSFSRTANRSSVTHAETDRED